MRTMLTILIAAGIMVAVHGSAVEEFQWSWDGEPDAAPVSEKPESRDQPVPRTEPPAPVVPAIAPPAPVVSAAPGDQRLTEAYQRLLKDNLELRRRIQETQGQEATIRRENERLNLEVRDLESRIQESVKAIGKMRQEQVAERENRDRQIDLEGRLNQAEVERQRLAEELERVRAQAASMPVALPVVPVVEASPAGPAVEPGSDLYRKVEQENRALKDRLAEADTVRRQAIEAREQIAKDAESAQQQAAAAEQKRLELERQLATVKQTESAQQGTIERLMQEIPKLEGELATLRNRTVESSRAAQGQQQEVELLRAELERREQRLVKAEKMAALMNRAREEVRQVDSREKRDMHFNMAVVYQREGRFRDAEQAYLSSLQIDPSDADVHYNLGILYEDELGEPGKAAVHYRRYLRLAPSAPDADQVREWLLRLDMK